MGWIIQLSGGRTYGDSEIGVEKTRTQCNVYVINLPFPPTIPRSPFCSHPECPAFPYSFRKSITAVRPTPVANIPPLETFRTRRTL